jgi:hypothetical protein
MARTLPNLRLLLTLCPLLSPLAARAQQLLDAEEVVHWAYATFMGTGVYQLDDSREVYVLNFPLEWTWREATLETDGQHQLGVRFHMPVSLGLHHLDAFGDFLDADNVGTVSVAPGVELDWLYSQRLRLRGYGHLGLGGVTGGGETAWIYDIGLRSRYAFRHGALDWGLVNEIFRAGYNPDDSEPGSLGGFMAGAEFIYPLRASDSGLALGWDVSYRWLSDNLTFLRRDASELSFDDEWQVGIALARPGRPFKLGFMKFAQLGLGYRFSGEGGFSAITLNFSSLFER